MANEAKQFTIGGVTHDVMDVGARQLITQLQATIDAITSGDTTTAIKTFQEVIDFLDGVTDDATLIGKLNELRTLIAAKYSKPASGIPASDLADGVIPDVSGFATKTDVNAKANSADVYTKSEVDGKVANAGKVKSVSVNNGTPAQPDSNGNVNVSVPTLTLDDVPTAGSNNAVKSGGIKTALDNLLANLHIVNNEWYIGNTATGVSAQGPAGNVNITDASQLVTILVNNLTTGGAGNILSAEMGKILRVAVQTLLDSLGEYCFPNGRPTLAWEGPKCNVTQNLTDVTSNFAPSRIDKNGSLEITLSPVDNLHVFLTGDVAVTMGGEDVTSTAWNANTGKVTIADVTYDVVITAKSSAYVQSGLAFMLDCKNRGGQSGHWIDLVGNIDFALTNVIEKDDGMVFNGSTSKGEVASGGLNVPYDTATIEAVIDVTDLTTTPSQRYPILANTVDGAAAATLRTGSNNILFVACSSNDTNVAAPKNMAFHYNVANRSFGSTRDTVVIDGVEPESPRTQGGVDVHDYAAGLSSLFAVGYGNISSTNYYFKGKILAIRVYKTKLTAQQIIYNHNIDKKRYNLQ